MKVTLILDDVKYQTEFARGMWDDENLANAISEVVEKTVLGHLGHVQGMPKVEE